MFILSFESGWRNPFPPIIQRTYPRYERILYFIVHLTYYFLLTLNFYKLYTCDFKTICHRGSFWFLWRLVLLAGGTRRCPGMLRGTFCFGLRQMFVLIKVVWLYSKIENYSLTRALIEFKHSLCNSIFHHKFFWALLGPPSPPGGQDLRSDTTDEWPMWQV